MSVRPKIFVLGDSRTGTMSLHNYFKRHGYTSIHYFVEQCGATEPLHINLDENDQKVLEFIRNSEFEAFSDYPVRTFWKSIYDAFPESYFILTVRTSTETWYSSMEKFFALFGRSLDRQKIVEAYELVNQDIRKHFRGSPERHFLEICIDDDSDLNTMKLSSFLDLPQKPGLMADNAASSFDIELISGRGSILGKSNDPVADTEVMFGDSKAILGEYGWMYLINDTNEFLNFQFGKKKWTAEQSVQSYTTLKSRLKLIEQYNTVYRKFIIPEKSIIYQEFLPKAFSDSAGKQIRPATILKDMFPEQIFYLDRYLIDAKSYGHIYFRGDSHPNWLGGYFIYRYIIEKLQFSVAGIMDACTFADLTQSVAQYDGDLFGHLDSAQLYTYRKVWGFMSGVNAFESLLKLELTTGLRTATRIDIPDHLVAYSTSRDVLVYQSTNSKLPKAVIFRDSTLDFVHELLAQHFSRSVFIWREGAVFEDVIQQERPDIVIHVMAERFVSAYPSFQPMAKL